MSFRNLMPPEKRAEFDRIRFEEARKRQELKGLSDKELADRLEHFMKNSFGHSRIAAEYRGSPTYDSSIWYIILPEVLERLRA